MYLRIVPISTFVLGLFLVVLGSFLPWGNRSWTPGQWSADGDVLGMHVFLGQLALAGCVTATLFQILFLARNRKYPLMLVLIGGIVATVGPAIWIVIPGFPNPPQSLRYEALYGVYVSLIGGIMILTSAIQGFLSVPRAHPVAESAAIGTRTEPRTLLHRGKRHGRSNGDLS